LRTPSAVVFVAIEDGSAVAMIGEPITTANAPTGTAVRPKTAMVNLGTGQE